MTLLHKTTRDYLIASVSILIFTGFTLFVILQKAVSDEMNEQLELQADQIFESIRLGNHVNAPLIKIDKVTDNNTSLGLVFGDSMVYDRVQKEMEEYHYLKETQVIGDSRYHVTVMSSHIGWDNYYLTIFFIFLLTAILLTLSGILINYFSNKKILKPFFENLKNVQAFSVSSPYTLQLHDSTITEFKELNFTLKDLTERSKKEYLALREFTENASHEIQIPLSIIQSKLDRMSQLEITEQMAGYITQAKSGVNRLSKMNKSLLLLAKLDNQLFTEQHEIVFNDVLDSHLRNMEDLFLAKNINLIETLNKTIIHSHQYLIDILISNFLSNALKYTSTNGTVKISLKNNILMISNTGSPLDFPEEYIFDRFTKNPENTSSTGLGLAIIKEICVLNHWTLTYDFQNGWHTFIIVLKQIN